MPHSIVQVDAFTSTLFAGNPAAVCLLEDAAGEEWMQRVAAEMNLSETAFLRRRQDGGYELRWFTPVCEVELCGHATLASAHVLWEDGHLATGEVARFYTMSGRLTAERRHGWIEMDFPAERAEHATAPSEVWKAVGAVPIWVGRNRFDYLIELESEEAVRELQPDFGRLRQIVARGFIVTARASTPGVDFVSRFFAPSVGVPEDPVTGSAHCCLAPYWAKKLGKEELIACQASARGGTVKVRWQGGDRVVLAGEAVTVLRGELV